MHVIYPSSGGAVAVMEIKEAVMIEASLMYYVAANPDSSLAVRMLRDVVDASERVEGAVSAPSAASE
ncbi:hypothetical protein [Streptomyces sp. 769]|uniref:hypothetical protein n=1 Tax=Streptomyces sp. 769 TaxID=1262452 RepID=UPI00057C62BA|nr:hypothetical protein [Streptomyces sp. 769]AJC58606.1 hypothetical protein GZL_06033 [Streptomyces sp. 769]